MEFLLDTDDPKRTWAPDELPPLYNGRSINEISEAVLILQKMATHMRKRRFDEGALRIDQPKLCFQLSGEGIPQVSVTAYFPEGNQLTIDNCEGTYLLGRHGNLVVWILITRMTQGFSVYQHTASHCLIEEFMLLVSTESSLAGFVTTFQECHKSLS